MPRINELFSLQRKISASAYDQRGIALPLVLMLLIVLSVLGTAAWQASQSSLLQSSRLEPTKRAEYLARSAVDATKEAWTDAWISNASTAPTEAHFFTRFDDSTNEFLNVSAEDADNYDEIIETTLSYDPTEGICRIEAVASVGSVKQRVSAVSEKLVDSANLDPDPPWYEVESKTYWDWFTLKTRYWGTILGNPDNRETDRINGQDITGSYHITDGIVNITVTQNGTLYLDRDEGYNIVGYQAKRISFNCPVNLYSRTPSGLFSRTPYSLVVSGETINFNQHLRIGDGHRGNLALHLPEGSGISGEVVYHNLARTSDRSKVVLDAFYGLVSFSQVTIEGSIFDDQDERLIENKTFYFSHPDGTDALMIGTEPATASDLSDFFGWTDPNKDFRLERLISAGYLIQAPNDIKTDYEVLFIYE